jgi:hypothetical protein
MPLVLSLKPGQTITMTVPDGRVLRIVVDRKPGRRRLQATFLVPDDVAIAREHVDVDPKPVGGSMRSVPVLTLHPGARACASAHPHVSPASPS